MWEGAHGLSTCALRGRAAKDDAKKVSPVVLSSFLFTVSIQDFKCGIPLKVTAAFL